MTAHIILIGFMGAGKTTVGKLVAAHLGWRFCDLDEVISNAADAAIPDIFRARGEAGFRALEAEALKDVLARDEPHVLATGGGAPCTGDNLSRMRDAGLVVALTAPLAELCARMPETSSRPLLDASTAGELQALYECRQPIYRQAHAVIDTSGLSPAEVCGRISGLVNTAEKLATTDAAFVVTAQAVCPIVTGAGSLDDIGAFAKRALPDLARAAIITDDNVAPLYAARAEASLAEADITATTVTVPAGERAKTLSQLEGIAETLCAAGLDRQSAIFALGGGVVGDLAGFVAATLFRGIATIQVPTTLLAMIDSAIGGKTGVNLKAGKNLVGAIVQPALVITDPQSLSTLPARELRAAYGELLKYGLLDGPALWDDIAALAPHIAKGAITPAITDVIRRAAAIKCAIVSADERELSGQRALLNLGHTIGHAIEKAAGYGQVLHGEAVALGLMATSRVSAALGLCPAEANLEKKISDTMAKAGLDTDLGTWLAKDQVLAAAAVDKKRRAGKIRFVALREIGSPVLHDLTPDNLARILRP